MTKGELISQIKNELRLINADNSLTNKFIWSIITKHLNWLIKRESSKLKIMKQDTIFQTSKCVEIEAVPTVDECCAKICTKCKIYRTKEKLPELYEDGDGVIIKSVYTIDGSIDFSPIKLEEYSRKLENPHSKYDQSKYYFYNNGYLYFPKSSIIRVNVKGYFTNEIVNTCDPEDKPCQSLLDTPTRIPKYFLGELMQAVLQELTGITLKIQPDEDINKNENRKN